VKWVAIVAIALLIFWIADPVDTVGLLQSIMHGLRTRMS
jgi:hypothetical protein